MKNSHFYLLGIILLFLSACSTPSTAIPELEETVQSLSAQERVFALAYSNVNGIDGFQENEDVLISKLLDTNNDGVVSIGDTIIMGQYPTTFEATKFADFTVKELVVVEVILVNQVQINLGINVPASTPGSLAATVSWISSTESEKYVETSLSSQPRYVDIFDNFSSNFFDTLVADLGSISQPQQEIERTIQNLRGDDSFIDVDGSAECLAGTYGVFKCVPAGFGTFVDLDGATTSTFCPVGTYQDEEGQTSCKPAPVGTYTSFQGQIQPTACPVGQTTLFEGASSVDDCIDIDTDGDGVSDNEDAYPNDPTRAVSCLAGSYGAFECTEASPGYFVATDAALEQTACPIGEFQNESGQTSCKLAPAGKFVNSPAAIEATNCEKGFYQNLVGQTSCLAAPLNTYVDIIGAALPIACPAGQITLAEASTDASDCIDPDSDDDGVSDANDLCPDTDLTADMPPSPKKNRFFVNSSGDFVDGKGNHSGFNIIDAGGCSASQIIDAASLGNGHKKFGISKGELIAWVNSLP